MVLIFPSNSTDKTRMVVERIYYQPQLLTEDQKVGSIEIEHLPEPEYVNGKHAVLYVNSISSQVWYEYYDAPLTNEEIIKNVLDENAVLKADLKATREDLTTAQEVLDFILMNML